MDYPECAERAEKVLGLNLELSVIVPPVAGHVPSEHQPVNGSIAVPATTVAWISQPEMVPHLSGPKKTSKVAGAVMLAARVKVAIGLLDRALAGEEVKIVPLLWQIKALRRFF